MQPSSPFVRFKVPLVQAAHTIAENFSLQHKTPHKAKQVHLNTLAVYSVRFWMQCMGIETDWENSESWEFVTQLLQDVADLDLPGIGRLECRPVLSENQSVHIPSDVHEDRIGYVVVQFDDSLDYGTLIGFVETAPVAEELLLNQLQSLENLPEHLEKSRQAKATKTPERLSQWFENIFNVNWLSVPVLFDKVENPAFSARSNLSKASDLENLRDSISRGRLIDLGIQINGHPVALVITITISNNEETYILAQVYPTKGLILPQDLQFIVLDEAGEICIETQARETDNWMKLEFDGEIGESFSIKLALRNASITEHFVI